MAEVLLKVDDGAGLEDGDVITAYSDHWIRFKWAELRCLPTNAKRNRDDVIIDPVCIGYHRLLYQYEVAQISSTEAVRYDSTTGETVIVNGDFDEFVRRRKLKATTHRIFQVNGRPTWFGGYLDLSEQNVSSIWDHLENTTDLARTDNTKYPLGRRDVRSFLPVSCVMSHAQSQALVEPQEDANGKPRGRRYRLRHWAAELKLTTTEEANVRNKRKTCDLRDTHVVSVPSFTDKRQGGGR